MKTNLTADVSASSTNSQPLFLEVSSRKYVSGTWYITGIWFSSAKICRHADSDVRPSAYYHTLLHSKFIRVRFLSRPIPTSRRSELTPSPRAATIIKNLRAISHTSKSDYAGAWTHAHHAQKRTIYAPTSTDSARDILAQPKNCQLAERHVMTCPQ